MMETTNRERKLEIRVINSGFGKIKSLRQKQYAIVNKKTGNLVDLNKVSMAMFSYDKEGIVQARQAIKLLEATA